VVTELEGLTALKSYLEEQPENTQTTPYLIKLRGLDLTGGDSPKDNLKALYKALVRYTALDLRDCTGESVPKLTLTEAPNKKKLVSLILPTTVKTIEADAFSGYEALVRLEAPGVEAIMLGAFKECPKLESVYMPLVEIIEDTTDVDKGAFRNCEFLDWVFLPRAHSIGGYAFYNCKALEAIFFPEGRIIGVNAFKNCSSLISASLPWTESIDYRAFYSCNSLLSIMLGKDPPALGEQVFTNSRPTYIYVPSAGREIYEETGEGGWTAALKAKIRSLPE
jgi:hypothetical protein